MTVTVDLMSLLLGLLVLAGIVLIIYLVIVLAKLIQTFNRVNQLLDRVRDPIAKTAEQLPELVSKADKVAGHIGTITESAQSSIPAVLDDVQSVTGNVRQSVDEVHSAVHQVKDGVEGVFGGAKETASQIGSIISIATTIIDLISRLIPAKKSKSRRTWTGRRR